MTKIRLRILGLGCKYRHVVILSCIDNWLFDYYPSGPNRFKLFLNLFKHGLDFVFFKPILSTRVWCSFGQHKGSGTLFILNCPKKEQIKGMWNHCSHPYATLQHRPLVDRTWIHSFPDVLDSPYISIGIWYIIRYMTSSIYMIYPTLAGIFFLHEGICIWKMIWLNLN